MVSVSLILFLCLIKTVFGTSYYTSYKLDTSQHYYTYDEKPEVHLHKLCTWNVLEWEDPIFKDSSNDDCNPNCGPNYIPHMNVPTGFAFHNDTVFVGVRRANGIYSTLNYFKICDIVDKICPKLRSYPSFELNEFLTEECSTTEQLMSVERFSVDKCIHEPKLWVFDTKGTAYKNKVYSFGEPSLKVYNLKTNKLVRNARIPSSLYDRNTLGIVQVVVHIVDCDTCDDAYAYLVDNAKGCLFVYSWKQNRFWRFDSPKFFGDAKHSDFRVTTPSGKQVKYFPNPHLFEVTVDPVHNELLYHARSSISAYALDLKTANNVSKSIVGPTEFNVKYVGEKNCGGQTGSQAINTIGTVWGIQEQNCEIRCYNRHRPLTPRSIRSVVSNCKQLPFLVDLKLEPEPHCYHKDSNSRSARHHPHNRIYVLTNNQKEIENGYFNQNYTNFGIYYVNEEDALFANRQCLPYDKEEYHHHRRPYTPPKEHKEPNKDEKTENPYQYFPETYHKSNTQPQTTRYETPENKPRSYEPYYYSRNNEASGVRYRT